MRSALLPEGAHPCRSYTTAISTTQLHTTIINPQYLQRSTNLLTAPPQARLRLIYSVNGTALYAHSFSGASSQPDFSSMPYLRFTLHFLVQRWPRHSLRRQTEIRPSVFHLLYPRDCCNCLKQSKYGFIFYKRSYYVNMHTIYNCFQSFK